jgi:N-acetylneuraminic acid mutarotase
VDTLPGYGKEGMDISPDGTEIYAAEGTEGVVDVIETASMDYVTSIYIGSYTWEVELTCDGSELYAARMTDSIPVIDTQTYSITYDIPIPDRSSGFGITICPQYVAEDITHWYYTGSLNNARWATTATLLQNGKVLIAGGGNTSGLLTSAELYDPATGIWTRIGDMNTPHFAHTATLLPDGKVLVTGGDDSKIPGQTAELYDPATGVWSYTGSMNEVRSAHTATLLDNGKVLVVGGDSYTISAELYDPATGMWSYTGNMNNARGSHTATLLPDGKVLVAGGYHEGNGTNSAELYDPDTGIWSNTGSMNEARAWQTATLLPNGNVLVAGSDIYGSTLASAELYDPALGTWSYTGSMNISRGLYSAVLLPNGNVLVSGGESNGGATTSAELYSPATGIWSNSGNMNDGRQWHTTTLLPSGNVLVAGGGVDLTTTELYINGVFLDPTTQSKQGGRGQVISYQETLSNYSGNSETFNLEALGNQWETQLSTEEIGPLADGASASFTITVTVPEDALWYDTDSVTIQATGVTSPELTAEAVLTTTAYAPPQISVEPSNLESTQFVGEVTTQTLTISNGNGVTLTYDVSQVDIGGNVILLNLDEPAGSNTFYDTSGFSNNATCSGDSCPEAGVPSADGTALSFDGVDDYLEIPHSSEIDQIEDQGKVSITAWAWINEGDYYRFQILEQAAPWFPGIGFEFALESSRILFSSRVGNAIYCDYGFNTGEWYHLAMSYDRDLGTIQFYVNGSQVCNKSYGEYFADTYVSPLYVGTLTYPGYYVDGLIDELYVFNRALSSDEIMAIYQGGLEGAAPWLSVDPAAGSVPTDSSAPVQVTLDATDMEPGEYETTLFISSNDPQQPLISVPVTMTVVQPQAGVLISPTEAALSGSPGELITYTFTLTNAGDVADSFTLEVSSTWTAALPVTSTGELEAGETFTFVVYVTIPMEAEEGDQDVALITATSDNDPEVSASAEATTTAAIMMYKTYLPMVAKN